MNKIFKVLILLLSITILTSCFKKDNSNEKNEDNGIKVSVNNNQTKEDRKTKYDAENKILKVGSSVEIKSGIEEGFPKDIKIYKDKETHINSNVPNYIFFVADKNDKLSNIANFYKDLFKKLGYKDLSLIIKKEDQESYQSLEFILNNPKYKEFKPEDMKGSIPIITDEKKYLQRVLIKINNEVPESIKDNMGLDGFFVEIYYNQL